MLHKTTFSYFFLIVRSKALSCPLSSTLPPPPESPPRPRWPLIPDPGSGSGLQILVKNISIFFQHGYFIPCFLIQFFTLLVLLFQLCKFSSKFSFLLSLLAGLARIRSDYDHCFWVTGRMSYPGLPCPLKGLSLYSRDCVLYRPAACDPTPVRTSTPVHGTFITQYITLRYSWFGKKCHIFFECFFHLNIRYRYDSEKTKNTR